MLFPFRIGEDPPSPGDWPGEFRRIPMAELANRLPIKSTLRPTPQKQITSIMNRMFEE